MSNNLALICASKSKRAMPESAIFATWRRPFGQELRAPAEGGGQVPRLEREKKDTPPPP